MSEIKILKSKTSIDSKDKNDENEYVDYVYWLHNQKDKIMIKCFEHKKIIYEGSLEDFIPWAKKREESEE